MNNFQTNNHTFFQPHFEELILCRRQSSCSLFASISNNDSVDLQLDIIDIPDIEDPPMESHRYTLENNSAVDQNLDHYINNSIMVESNPRHPGLFPPLTAGRQSKTTKSVKNRIYKVKKASKVTKSSKSSNRSPPAPKTFYQKNICRNIVRKAIRSMQTTKYDSEILAFCSNDKEFFEDLKKVLVSNVETITGPAALRAFLQPLDEVARVFKKFLLWFLQERYVREAVSGGQMSDLQKYVCYKNQVLLPLLHRL